MQTNFEHYKDEILKITNFSGGGLAMLKSDRTLTPCDTIKCEDCMFDCVRTNPHQMQISYFGVGFSSICSAHYYA